MARLRPTYAGFAGAAVFLVGLLLLGNPAVRLAVSAVIVFAVALAVSSTASRRLLVLAVAVAICSALVAGKAASCQVTGQATCLTWASVRGLGTEVVTREESPARFRRATNTTWEFSLLLALVSAACFLLRRPLANYEEDIP
jgi:hypothetical protein